MMQEERFLNLCREENRAGATPYLYHSTNLQRFTLVLVYSSKVYRVLGEGSNARDLILPLSRNYLWSYEKKLSLHSKALSLPCNGKNAHYYVCHFDTFPDVRRRELGHVEVPKEFLSLPTVEEQIEMLDKIILALHL